MRLIKCDEDVMKYIPYGIISKYFENRQVSIIPVLTDDDKLNFLVNSLTALNDVEWIYIDNTLGDAVISEFDTNMSLELEYVSLPQFYIHYDKNYCMIRYNRDGEPVWKDVELFIRPLKDDYDKGIVSYVQRDRIAEKICRLEYTHPFRCNDDGNVYIYDYHLNQPKSVLVGDTLTSPKDGFVNNDSILLERDEVESTNFKYDITQVRKYGLGNYLFLQPFPVEGTSEVFYKKIFYISKKDNRLSSWPFSNQYDEIQTNNLIVDNGFKISVPDEVVRIYNQEIPEVRSIKELIQLVAAIDKEKDDGLYMKLKLFK